MAAPVSWFMIEQGWQVVAEDGTEIGYVESVVGDSGVDIFNGLAVSTGLLDQPRYVPAERVTRITEGRVELGLRSDELERLEAFEEPPESLEIGGDEASRADRVADVFLDPEVRPHRADLLTRLRAWLAHRRS